LHSDDADDVRVIEDVAPLYNHFPPSTFTSPMQLTTPPKAGSTKFKSPPHTHSKAFQFENNMLPPSVPIKPPSLPSSSISFPDQTFPIRPLGTRRKHVISLSPSPILNSQSERLYTSPLPMIPQFKRRSNPVHSHIIEKFLDLEAEVSDDDGVNESSECEAECESDRR
jgi:hypothetical protein